MKRVIYGVNEQGIPIGEAHHNARLTDQQVDLIRDLYEEGMVSYRTLAQFAGAARSTISDICNYRRRAATPADYRTVRVPKV